MNPTRIVRVFTLALTCIAGLLSPAAAAPPPAAPQSVPAPAYQPISAFVRRIFEDKAGNFWFGTNGEGVLRYNGRSLESFSIQQGFGGVAVRGIVQDKNDTIWFATESGLIRYDGDAFTTYTTKDGLAHDDIWSLFIDREGVLWIGTFGGVCRFDGKMFTPFDLPESKPDPVRGVAAEHVAIPVCG